VTAEGIGLDAWLDEPDYRAASRTLSGRGAFIITKLTQLDAPKLRTLMVDLWRDEKKDPRDITKLEWKVILEYIGASVEEVWDVQRRMGRVWR
jgi:hypothetical protein